MPRLAIRIRIHFYFNIHIVSQGWGEAMGSKLPDGEEVLPPFVGIKKNYIIVHRVIPFFPHPPLRTHVRICIYPSL